MVHKKVQIHTSIKNFDGGDIAKKCKIKQKMCPLYVVKSYSKIIN